MSENHRRNGEARELLFHLQAIEYGFSISTPLLTESYDCILDNGKQLLKVQIKTSTQINSGKGRKDKWYVVNLKRGTGAIHAYAANEVDIFAVYIVPEKTWFFIPRDYVDGLKRINLAVTSKGSRYYPFMGNWEIFNNVM